MHYNPFVGNGKIILCKDLLHFVYDDAYMKVL
jgi:hypothetical protein